MSKRRKSREVALQFLYQLDLHSEADPSRHGAEFWERYSWKRLADVHRTTYAAVAQNL